MKPPLKIAPLAFAGILLTQAAAQPPAALQTLLNQTCLDCHSSDEPAAGLDLSKLAFQLQDSANRERWIRIHDRVEQGEMPPPDVDFPPAQKTQFVEQLAPRLHRADADEVARQGRGPIRRLNRDEYQQNLRDVLELPILDIRDMLPEDRESELFNKTTETLDLSRVQLTAYLEAAEAALLQAIASGVQPPPSTKYRAVGRKLFHPGSTFGNRQAMFFAKNSKWIDNKLLAKKPEDPSVELALFRSPHWPYYGYPQGFVAKLTGRYRVRFSGRSVVQTAGFQLLPGKRPQPMTFRARKPSGPDVSGDVRATGGWIDLQPQPRTFETVIFLKARETFEYSLLGLPVPLARNVDGGPPTYRYPPFPPGGQPGAAFQWLEVEGPLAPETWPPPSHRVLFGDLPIRAAKDRLGLPVEVVSQEPENDARRLLRRFIARAARRPLPEQTRRKFERLVLDRLRQGAPFAEAMLTGYKAFLCSGHMLYLQEPPADDHFAIASRLSHFLANTRPDSRLLELAAHKKLRDAEILRSETERLITSPGFERFVKNFTDYWLDLRHLHRGEPDARLYPEYRFDAYLIESAERETRAFFTAMVRENLPAQSIVDADFAFVNDRLAEHYQLPPQAGSSIRKVSLPAGSPYGGLLTQAAILKTTANGVSTSPVIRGAWVMERLLGQPPPPPPASVPAVEPDIRGAKTIRELLALHAKAEACAGCHARFDPVGLALENFDILGRWRTRYRSLQEGEKVTGIDRAGHDFAYALASPVDSSGELLDGRRFQDIRQLKRVLAAEPRQLARNLLHQFTVYATGTPVRFSDRQEIEEVLDACAKGGYRTGDLLIALVRSRIFIGKKMAARK